MKLTLATLFSIVPLFLLFGQSTATAQGNRAISLDLGGALRARQLSAISAIGRLAAGGRQTFNLRLPRRESLELRVPLVEAPFNGTQLNAQINGRRLAPYFAFGGDTRYDTMKGKPGMRPPLATIEGRWVIPACWLRQGNNELILWTTGVRKDAVLARLGPQPSIRIDGIMLGSLDGARLPQYANSVYYDFNVWAQGYPWGDEPNRLNYDLALLGVLNGKGMPAVIPALGAPESSLWAVKRTCEDNALGWGMGHQEFYTIWEFAGKPQLWADFIDVDKNPETQAGGFHDQTVYLNLVPRGADIFLYNSAKYASILEPLIRSLAPYTDFYNFKCEQTGSRGQGFGENGEQWKDYGVHGDLWARNYYVANKAARDLVMQYNPEVGRVQEMNHWRQGLRPVLYDTALRRGQPMGDIIDILMTHFAPLEEEDRGSDGLPVKQNAFDRQYPYPDKTQPGNHYPEVAIDFNRYRLSRTEKDMTPGDPKINRWGNGQPFDYRAGFRGDELMYNSENGVWNTGYCALAPYQFLHGFFSYSLLPTGASEPRDLKITTRLSLTKTRDLSVRRYGEWIDGVGHTKRLRTVDPLYGDLFGWTGQEYCNFGDYISMVGIKEPHHRLPPNDAFGLVRRICYAFVTTGPVVPVAINTGHSDQLFVKALVQTFNSKTYIGLYAANFGNKPERLDATLPIVVPAGARALVFDDRAWDWKRSGRPLSLRAGTEFRYQATVPPLGAWLVLIPATPEMLAATFALPAAPVQTAPVPDAAIADGQPILEWEGGDTRGMHYTVEIAREAVFRPRDRVELTDGVIGTQYVMAATLQPRWRYFWRVAAVNKQGLHGLWSTPRSFVYRWPEYSQAYPSQPNPGLTVAPTAPDQPAEPDNLAWQGEIWGTGGYMHAPSRAVDGQAFSYWRNEPNEASVKNEKPAEWCVIWPQQTTLHAVKIQWFEDLPPLEFTLQVSDDGQQWTDLHKEADNIAMTTEFTLPRPASARFFRIYITRMRDAGRDVGIREVMLR